jgi:hypothetical protein
LFCSDAARDQSFSVDAFATTFLQKYPADTVKRNLKKSDGTKVVVSKQARILNSKKSTVVRHFAYDTYQGADS